MLEESHGQSLVSLNRGVKGRIQQFERKHVLPFGGNSGWHNINDNAYYVEQTLASIGGGNKVVEALGRVYFLVFAPFILRALSEGVYGRPLEDSDKADSVLADIKKDWDDIFPTNAD